MTQFSTDGARWGRHPQPGTSDDKSPPVRDTYRIRNIVRRLEKKMKRMFSHEDEAGMSTAEYAVGTVGACTFGGVLVKIAQSDWFGDLVKDVLDIIPSILPF